MTTLTTDFTSPYAHNLGLAARAFLAALLARKPASQAVAAVPEEFFLPRRAASQQIAMLSFLPQCGWHHTLDKQSD